MQLNPFVTLSLLLITLLQPSLAQTPSNFAFSTTNPLIVQFNTTIVSPQGELLPEAAVALPPTLGTTAVLPGTYLAVMVDPGAGTATDVFEVLHYLLPGLTSPEAPTTRNGTAFYPLRTAAQPLAPYLVPAPTPGDAHSYTLTLWKQPDGFAVPGAFLRYLPLNASDPTNRYPFNLTGLVAATGLGQPLAAGYFDVQNTTASATTTAGHTTTSGGASSTTSSSGHSTSEGSSTATGKTVAATSSAALIGAEGCVSVWSVGCSAWALLALAGVAARM